MKNPSGVRPDGGSGGGGGPAPTGGSGGEDGEGDAHEGKGPFVLVSYDALKKIFETPASGMSCGNPFAIFSFILATFIATWTKIDNTRTGLDAKIDAKIDATNAKITNLNTDFRVFAACSLLALGYLVFNQQRSPQQRPPQLP